MNPKEIESKLQELDGEALSPFTILQDMLLDFMYTGIEDIFNKYTNEQLFAFLRSLGSCTFDESIITLTSYTDLLNAYSLEDKDNMKSKDLATESNLKYSYVVSESKIHGDIWYSVLSTLNSATSRGNVSGPRGAIERDSLFYNGAMDYPYSNLCQLISQVPAKSKDSGLVFF